MTNTQANLERCLDGLYLRRLERERWLDDIYSEFNPFRNKPWAGNTNHADSPQAQSLDRPLVRMNQRVSETQRLLDSAAKDASR